MGQESAGLEVDDAVHNHSRLNVRSMSDQQARASYRKSAYSAENRAKTMVSSAGFEPTAPRLGIWCSIRLSYEDAARCLARNRGRWKNRRLAVRWSLDRRTAPRRPDACRRNARLHPVRLACAGKAASQAHGS